MKEANMLGKTLTDYDLELLWCGEDEKAVRQQVGKQRSNDRTGRGTGKKRRLRKRKSR